jgi:hypothetical protein
MANDSKEFPSKPYNKFVPRSQESSGSKLDEICGSGEIPQAEGGTILADAMPKLDGGKK